MKKRILVALAGSLIILSAWIFVPEVDEGPVVFASVDEAEVIYESETSEESIQEKVWNESNTVRIGAVRSVPKLESERICRTRIDIEESLNEQETGEETREEVPSYEGREVVCSDTPNTGNIPVTETTAYETHAETVAESTETEGAGSTERAEEVERDECSGEMESTLQQSESTTEGYDGIPAIPYYSVTEAGFVYVLDLDIQRHLYQRLAEKGIGWFMPYAIMIAFQESHFNPRAENRNGLDKGLFQYRITYYPGGDIFNPYEQIDIFTQAMANRANIGCSINEMISRHNTSDYGAYNQAYVNQVLQHQAGLALISN